MCFHATFARFEHECGIKCNNTCAVSIWKLDMTKCTENHLSATFAAIDYRQNPFSKRTCVFTPVKGRTIVTLSPATDASWVTPNS